MLYYSVLFILSLLINFTTNAAIETNTTAISSILICAINLYMKTSDTHLVILYSTSKNFDVLLSTMKTGTIINLNRSVNYIKSHGMVKYYIILEDNISAFQKFINKTYYTPIWNPRAKFLIVHFGEERTQIQEIFKTSWHYNVMNIIVVYNNSVYTYYPYSNNICGNISPEVVTKCNGEFPENLFPNKIPKMSPGCHINISAVYHSPHIINPNIKSDNPNIVGLEAVIVNNLLEKSNLTGTYLKNNFSYWGYKFPDGSATLLYKTLFDREAHIIIGRINRNISFAYDFDSTRYYIYDNFRWYVPKAKPLQPWKNLVLVFEPLLWLSLLIIFLIHSLALWLLIKLCGMVDLNLSWCFTKTWCILFQVSTYFPKRASLKIMFYLWTLISLVISTSYQPKLVSFLTSPVYEHQISNIYEMVHSKLPYGSLPDVLYHWHGHDDEESKLIRTRFISFLDLDYYIDLLFKEKFAIVLVELRIETIIRNNFKNKNMTRNLYAFQKVAKYGFHSMYTLKGFPFLNRFNFLIICLGENGLLWKWKKDCQTFTDSTERVQLLPLSLTHMFSVFFIFTAGIALSLCCFLCEIFIYKFNVRVY